ncbi:fibronectin type III domain-containing protein [Actinospica sp. MGRD01-02]|uniref:alpha-amylase n=1 Tax=Actinospica acidithermotolerans TaxID=2828514 RepID=A0A941IKX9_9ACTN|nr:glycoside hydrolase family 15 protein [Actinospica acidithermotolerans]MBR7831104.1 fibronectin type III domain-containing protein [Actinospica acidithermotolerans]
MHAAHPRLRALRPLISAASVLALTATALVAGSAAPALAATASGGPGTTPYWNESGAVQGFADSTSSSSKVAYTIGNGELENVFYPEDDEPDTYGLQYYVTDGSSFSDSEVSNTTHAVTLADSTSLTWQQTNTAANGDFKIVKTYIADPNSNVVLIQTTFTNETSTPLYLYADYQPYLDNQGDGNTGGTDSTTGDLEAVNGSVASALSASTGFTESSTGYVGTSSSGVTQLASGYGLSTTYSGVSSSGHLDQTAEIPVSTSGSTTFTLALAFDTTEASAISDASTALTAGFSSLESGFESGWHTWLAGLNSPPASVSSSSTLLNQYYISLMELKADEDKTYTGGFVASPTDPWGASDSAASTGNHGYHLVWTRDEYQMASALLSAGDSTDAAAALAYILKYEVESSGEVKQNTWLNGNQEWGGQQMDEAADPIILAYQLGDTSSGDWSTLKTEANYLVANGPYTGQDRWEENGGYSPSTIAAEIAGLVCAYSLATTQGDTSDASTYLSTAETWASDVDGWTYTTSGSIASGDYFVRIAPNGTPNASDTISISNGGGSYDQRAVVDAGFLELVRLGIKSASATDIANSLTAVDDTIATTTPEGTMYHRYNHDGYGETSTGADYTGAGVGNLWPVFNGERGEYDIADGNTSGAETQLEIMQASATGDGQISEQVWGSSTAATASGTGWTLGQADNSATPLMWSMAQYVRLADDISNGVSDTPKIVCQTFSTCSVTAPSAPTGLKVTATTSTTASLSWTASSGATSYKVLRGGTVVGTTTSTGYTDTGLTAGTSYTYTVEAVNSAGTSSASSSVTATTNAAGTAPNAPTGLTVGTVTTTTVPLTWTAATTSGSYAVASYYVLRGGSIVGTTTSTSYTDTGLTPGTTYSYTVEAYDSNGDVSAASSAVSATTKTAYTETFNVTVPVNTAASGDTVYLDGDFSVLGGSASDWSASGIAMTKVDDTHYTATVTSASSTTLDYKYDLGGSWSNVEETGSCGYVANRSVTVSSGTETDTVDNWAGPNTCGNAQAVIDVTVPSSTPSGDEVYISGDFSALGIGMSSSNDWSAGLYPMTKIATNEWQIIVPSFSGDTLAYKFDLNGTWTNVEEGSSCSYVSNRSFYFNGADSTYTASDTVTNWAALNGC